MHKCFNTFITILFMYMFQAISCSSLGDQIALIQHLVTSLSVSDRSVQRLRKNLCTERSLADIDVTRCCINPLNSELNPICSLLALLAHHFLHASRIRFKSLTIRLLLSYIYIYIYIYIYGAPILDVSRSYTTTHHSR